MTFSYDPVLSTDRDKLRFLIQDTDAEQPLLQNEELQFLIAQWENKGSLYYVAARACQNIAMKFAREVSFSSDSQSVGLSELMGKYQEMAKEMMAADNSMGVGELFVGGEGGANSRGPSFGVGMHDDIDAGPQYIGWDDWPHPEQWGTSVP